MHLGIPIQSMSSGYKIRNQNKIHFLTFTIVAWVDIFTRVRTKEILITALKYYQINQGLILYSFVIMSNHIHIIASSKKGFKLSEFVRNFKSFTARRILDFLNSESEKRSDWIRVVFKFHASFNARNSQYQVWIQNSHPIELESPEFIFQRLDYLHNNPVKAKIVDKAEHYLYSSARVYKGQRGMLELEIIDDDWFDLNGIKF